MKIYKKENNLQNFKKISCVYILMITFSVNVVSRTMELIIPKNDILALQAWQ